MKKILSLTLLLAFCVAIYAQDKPTWPKMDASSLDAITYPTKAQWRNYSTGDDRTVSPMVRVVYSRPKMNERKIFGELVPYGKEWRLGANEATTLQLYTPAEIGGTAVNAGIYTLFAMPDADVWTIYISSENGIWGGENRDMSKNITSVKVPTKKTDKTLESLSITFQEIDDMHVHLLVGWENTQVAIPIAFNPIIYRGDDASPMDLAQYPDNSRFTNYLEGEAKNVKPLIHVLYSRPFKKDRNVFGELLKVGDIWRLGANESTEITFYENVKVSGQEIRRGRYALYAQLNEGSWDLIFSTDLPSWGSSNRDETKDIAKVNVKTSMADDVMENLGIYFEEKSEDLVHMHIGWDKTRVVVPISF